LSLGWWGNEVGRRAFLAKYDVGLGLEWGGPVELMPQVSA
jgi:hypothetical protein